MPGKVRETGVTEYQTILKQDEFLYFVFPIKAYFRCYVILVRYRPWDLPRNESIVLQQKYCITYVSKAKCKLLISTGVDLIQVPKLLRGMDLYSQTLTFSFCQTCGREIN